MLNPWMSHRDVFTEMDDWVRRIDAGMHRARGLDGHHGLRQATRPLVPGVSVEESEAGYRLVADVPGLTPDRLSVTFDAGVLTIAGASEEAAEDGQEGAWTPQRRERHLTSFERAFRLSQPVDASGIAATLEHGVLTVSVPKRVPATLTIPVVQR